MKNSYLFLPGIFLFILLHDASGQGGRPGGQGSPSRCDTTSTAVFRNNDVFQQWTYKTDKKTKRKTFTVLHEFDDHGCVAKTIIPDPAGEKDSYMTHEWVYDPNGYLLKFVLGKIDKDSAQHVMYSEKYSYTASGLISHAETERYESENSQTMEKWDFIYSDKGDLKETGFTLLRVKKDTISYDQRIFSVTGALSERTIRRYFPKGLSDFMKYDSKNVLVESMQYEKGAVKSRKLFTYVYDAQGNVVEENAKDLVGKISEKKKYEKGQIAYTKYDLKGKVTGTSTLPLPAPAMMPALPAAPSPQAGSAVNTNYKEAVKKERADKKGNKTVENFSKGGASKLLGTEIYNKQGLLTESAGAGENVVLQYDYTFY